MRLPLPDRNTLDKESRNLRACTPSRLSDAEPSIQQRQAGRAGVDEADHGAQTSVVVQVRGREGEGPGDKVKGDNGGRHDLVLVLADGHFAGDGVGQRTDTEIVAWGAY